MRRYLIIVFALFLFGNTAKSQMSPTLDDFGRIVLNTYLPQQMNIPEEAKKLLDTKLNQITSNYGIGGNAVNSRFIITAKVNIGTKDIIAGPPQMIAQNLNVTLFIGDALDNKIFSNSTLSIKGVGTNENKAFINAINRINHRNKDLAAFIDEGKTKIINYYNSNCDIIIKESQALVGQEKYSKAIYNLSIVPDVCKDCYFKSKGLMVSIYQKKIDADCKTILSRAKIEWSGQKNINTAEKVLNILSEINPNAYCFDEVNSLTNDISNKLISDEKVRLEFALKEYNDELDLEKKRIDAYKQVALEYAKNQPETITYSNIYWW